MAERKDTPAPAEGNEASTQDQIPQSKPWTLREFGGKTVWDWMDLLMVPIMLSLITVVFAWQQDARQQRIEDQRAESALTIQQQNAQDEALQAYLDQMSQLMLDRKLLEAEQGTPLYTLAQARTSTLILRLDAEHNESVTRFLINSGLAESSEASARLLREITLSHATLSDAYLPLADLSDADLSGANLSKANLSEANLSEANLPNANLSSADLLKADLSKANLSEANLSSVNLKGAILKGAILKEAKLINADFSGREKQGALTIIPIRADLTRADLTKATLQEADLAGCILTEVELTKAALQGADLSNAWLQNATLTNADLTDANLRDANLYGANLSNAYLSSAVGVTNEELDQQAEYLQGATMPNGQKYEDWLKSKGSGEDGENSGPS